MSMPDLGSLLREHYEEIAPPIDVERLADRLLAEERLRTAPPRSRGVLVAIAAAIVVLLVIGSTTLFINLTEQEVVEEPTTTTVPQTTVPDEEAAPESVDPAPDDSALPATLDVGVPYTVLDREGDVGDGASMIIRSDGVPMVAYAYHPVDGSEPSEIRIATCADAGCSETGAVRTIADIHEPPGNPDNVGPLAVEIRTLLASDGLPIVIWSEWEDAEDGGVSYLMAYKCADADCISGTLSMVAEQSGTDLWVALDPDGLPLIAQRKGHWQSIELQLVKCTDPACSDPVEHSVLDLPEVGWGLALANDQAGHLVIAAGLSGAEGEMTTLGIGRCADPLCTEPPEFADTGITAGELSAVAVDTRDRPVVLLSRPASGPEGDDFMFEELVLVACTDATCSMPPLVTHLAGGSESQGDMGDISPFGSLVLADDGAVTVTHISGGDLHVMSCSDPTCPGGPVDVPVLPSLGGWPETSLAVDPDGNPVFALHSDTDLGVFVCSDPTCAESQVLPLSDAPGPDWAVTNVVPADVELSGTNPAIEVGVDGNPVIAYLGRGDEVPNEEGVRSLSAPKLVLCGDTSCSVATTRVLDGQGDWVAMTMLSDGRPVVAYPFWPDDGGRHQLRIAWCADPECSTWTSEVIAESGWINSTLGLVARPDESIVAVYQDTDDYYTYAVSCKEGACAGAERVKIDSLVDPNDNEWGMRWWMNSLDAALLPDGRPVIAAAQSNGEVRYVECLDQACSESERITLDKTLGSVTAAVAVGPNGLPILAHYDDGQLRFTACHDSSCAGATVTSIGEASGSGCGQVKPSIAFGADGNPMITYWAPRAVMLAQCHDPMCTASTADIFANVRTYDLAVLPTGSPVLTYFAYSEEEPPEGEETCCGLIDLRVAACTSGTCVGE